MKENQYMRSLQDGRGELARAVTERDHIQGSLSAPAILVEYGDYECPYCGLAYPMIKKVQKRLGDSLCFVFRNFPLRGMHPHAEHAAETAEAAGAQGKFWEMHDLLFENQNAIEDTDLVLYARALRLDHRRIFREVSHGLYAARVREDFSGGALSGVNGTPTFFINGARYDGPHYEEDLLASLMMAAEQEGQDSPELATL
jgi:protein-disulfide isomerase